jgi:hypothetical protein
MSALTPEQAKRLREAQEREAAENEAIRASLAPLLACGKCGSASVGFVDKDAVCRDCGHRQAVVR